ncbi:MAG: methyltransferase domain-containing protein, partial [Candidatus Aminicenantaceae bacterium]
MKKRRFLFVILAVLGCLTADGWQTKQPDVIFVPTPNRVVEEMLRVSDMRKDDLIYDLGCGDGRIIILAAQKVGSRGVGIDIDPQRIKESRQNASKAGVDHLVQFLEQDLFHADFSEATVVTLYLLPMLNLQLRPKLLAELRPGTRVISHDFGMNEWIPDQKTVVVIGERHHWVYHWIVPANVIGRWELSIAEFRDRTPYTMQLEQVYQYVVGAVILEGSRKYIKNAKLSGSHFQFELDLQKGGEVLSMFFEGKVLGDVITGTARWNRGPQEIKSPWRAVRDPSTVEPIDV